MKRIILIIFVFVCCIKTFSQQKTLDKAKNYILTKVDSSFYGKYFSFNEKVSLNKKTTTETTIVFNFKIQENPLITKLIILNLDKNSDIDVKNSPINVKQLNACLKNPNKCNLPMDENAAIKIAEREGLKKNKQGWSIEFVVWAGIIGDYRWVISNTPLSESTGENIIIKAITGEVEHSGWIREE